MSWRVWSALDEVFAGSPRRGPGAMEVSKVIEKHMTELLHLVLLFLGPGATAAGAEQALEALVRSRLERIVSGYEPRDGAFSTHFKAALEGFAHEWPRANREIGAAMEELTARERAAYRLHNEGMAESEISGRLRIPEAPVCVRLMRARRKLRGDGGRQA